jgi:glycosyltransferase involved in cell wall biosynthesis
MNFRKIAFLTEYDARNINRWSGTAFYMSKSLREAGFDVEYLGPLAERGQLLIKTLNFVYSAISKKHYLPQVEPVRLKSFARQAEEKLKNSDADIVLSPNMWPIAYLKTNRPVILWADCTFASMLNFYPYYSNLCKRSLRFGNLAEQKCLHKCSITVFASQWAAESAIRDYNVPPERVYVVPYGANIECNRTQADIEKLIEKRDFPPCRLLFIGKIWTRKGGDVAIEVARELNENGVPTEIYLVGSLPQDKKKLPEFVKPIGFIDKATEDGRRQFNELFEKSHFLIVPSRAEAYGIVFCEASSYGLPSIATNVGGIPTVVRDYINGKTFPLSAPPREYARYIKSLMENFEQYKHLARSSFNEFLTRLNWKTAVEHVKELIDKKLCKNEKEY